MAIKVLEINLPDYKIENKLDYDQLGRELDKLIEENLEDGKYVERSIGLIDHPNKTIDELTELILKYGTDKYDKDRESIFEEEFSCYEFDIHGSEFELINRAIVFNKDHFQKTYYGQNIYCFHKLAKFDRGYSVRVGISMIYDKKKLLPPLKQTECEKRIEKYSKYLYRFKDGEPLRSLRALIKIR